MLTSQMFITQLPRRHRSLSAKSFFELTQQLQLGEKLVAQATKGSVVFYSIKTAEDFTAVHNEVCNHGKNKAMEKIQFFAVKENTKRKVSSS